MWVALAAAVIGWIFAAAIVVISGAEKRDMRADHQLALAAERARVDNLTAQLQANAQGLQFYPSLPASEPVPERHFVRDETGLIEYEVDPADDDFAAVGDF